MKSYQEQALAYLRGQLNDAERNAFEDALVHSEELRSELESSRALIDMLDAASQESIVRQVNAHIQQAIRDRASDIHILPNAASPDQEHRPGPTSVYYRIDGKLVEAAQLPGEQHRALIDRWKIMAEMNVAEQRLTQDGRIKVRYLENVFDLRVNVLPTVTGERITARILDLSRQLLALEQLGMDVDTLAAVKRMVERPHGFVLLAGTAASGKTTYAYALLRHIQSLGNGALNIMTVEDPVEYQLPGMSQVGVNRRTGMHYPNVLRGIMRSDPDVIYVAEMRDEETAQLSIELAVTGHLILSQLNVASAVQVVQRLRDIGVANHLLAGNLVGSIGLRLVRKVCPDCAVNYDPSPRDLARAGLSAVEDGPFRKGMGCERCRQTGYRGRIGLFEAWEVDDRLRIRVADKASTNDLWLESFGVQGGSLWDDARYKVRRGLITVEDAVWALFDYPQPHSSPAAVSTRKGIIDLSELI